MDRSWKPKIGQRVQVADDSLLIRQWVNGVVDDWTTHSVFIMLDKKQEAVEYPIYRWGEIRLYHPKFAEVKGGQIWRALRKTDKPLRFTDDWNRGERVQLFSKVKADNGLEGWLVTNLNYMGAEPHLEQSFITEELLKTNFDLCIS